MKEAMVLDSRGRRLSPCSLEKALRLLEEGRAVKVSGHPLTIQLPYPVELSPQPAEEALPGQGKRLLLHICCAPCATYPLGRLRQLGYQVDGLWYNPNIHPYGEHQARRQSLQAYAQRVDLAIHWGPYDMPAFLRAVAGKEDPEERCPICYRLRLERTARQARELGYQAFTTTLLVSPFQDQEAILAIGEELERETGVAFHGENFRRGWAERGRLTKEHGLYRQEYCGCLYSEWERYRREEGP